MTWYPVLLQWHKTEAAQTRWERYHQMLTDMVVSRKLDALSNPTCVDQIRSLPRAFYAGPPPADTAKPSAPSPQLHSLTAFLHSQAPQKADAPHASSRSNGGANKRVALSRSLSTEPVSDEEDCLLLDTVGAVCVDSSGASSCPLLQNKVPQNRYAVLPQLCLDMCLLAGKLLLLQVARLPQDAHDFGLQATWRPGCHQGA